MKKLLCALLVAAILCGLCGCGLLGPGMSDLCGRWTMVFAQDADTAQTVLENQDFYEEEIALIDLESMECVMVVEFREDKTYGYYFDIEATKVQIREFYEGVLEDLYEGRDTLVSTYLVDMTPMTKEEFDQFYAELFGVDTVDILLDSFVDYSFDYDVLAEPIEEGTFRIRLGEIYKIPAGKTEEEAVGLKIEDTTLTLTYADGDEVYQKAQ